MQLPYTLVVGRPFPTWSQRSFTNGPLEYVQYSARDYQLTLLHNIGMGIQELETFSQTTEAY